MFAIKKGLSFLLSVCLICACIPFTASAKAQVRIEKAVSFDNSAYIRFSRHVVGVSEDFSVQIDAYDEGGEPAPICLGTEDVQIFTSERVEVFLPLDVWINTVHIHGLVLSDGTTADYTIRDDNEDFTQTFRSGAFAYAELRFEQDALTVYEDYAEYYAAVGSKWKLDFSGDIILTDKYLPRHAELRAEGIGMEKQGNKYVFTSTGDGTVSIVIGGYICETYTVHIREKREIKQTMLRTAFENSILSGMAFVYWLGPMAFLALPLSPVFGIVKVVRMLLA